MSTHAVSLEGLKTARLRLLLTRPAVAPLALGGLTLGLILLTWNTWGNPANDTGYDTLAGIRVSHGDLPYLDFTYYYGPLTPFALGLVALVGGSGMWPAVVFGLIVATGIVFATYALGTALAGPVGGFIAGALTAAVAYSSNALSFVDPHTFSATLGLLTTLCFLLCLHRFAFAGTRLWLLAAGGCFGLVCLTRFEFALAAIAVTAVWLTLRVRARLNSGREVAVFAIPALLIPAAAYGSFLAAVSPHRLLFENLYPRDFLDAAGNHVLRLRAPWTISSFASLGARLVLYALGIVAVLFIARLLERRGRFHRVLVSALIAGGCLVAAVSLADSGALRHGLQYAYGWIPAGATLAAVLLVWRNRHPGGDWSVVAQTELMLAVALAVVAGSCYAAFYIDATNPQMAVYAFPLAAPFLVRLHFGSLAPNRSAALLWTVWLVFLAAATTGLALKDASVDTATVRGPGGAIKASPEQAAVYRSAVAAIDSRTHPGEAILLAPQLTWLYPVTERKNPLPQLSLLPGVLNGPGQEREAIRRLDAAGVRLAVIDVHQFTEYGQGSFGVTFDQELARWIRRNFTRAATFTGAGPSAPKLVLWSRRVS